ncbi:hypothetical protein I633_06155 [Alteromonas mediterranea 615]|uniref:Alginate export domain-containing protein n=1 Tax=Alteromonas mediterranea 615 TaxID=1300253 RepID=S5AAT5_9ALTE|nr:hypothetical protein I633_06155 [Alteromonas mediterranea 615]
MIADLKTLLGIVLALLPFITAADTQITVKAAIEQRSFFQDPLYSGQYNSQLSAFIEPEIYHSWNDETDSITFKPFYRWDQRDSERSHGDIRELMWLHVGEDWELRTGIGIIYWGQAESLHLVDVINQTDLVEALDGEDKLGQPMVNLTLIRDWGNLDLFVLPGFRERTFPGLKGRFRPEFEINQDNAIYESSAEDRHIDYAMRWSHTLDAWDIGLSYFNGTARDPSFVANSVNNKISLTPYYGQMEQLGIDLLMAIDDWLYKFEGIYRDVSQQQSYFSGVAGFEYTSVGIFDTVWDLGWLLEYQYDNDHNTKPVDKNALMLGTRLALNDINGSEVLLGYVQDLDYAASHTGFIEASSRINDNWKWRIDAWFLASNNMQDIIYNIRQDDYIQISLEYYF